MNIDAPTIKAELDRILTSHCFRSRKTLCKFLSYVVNATLTEGHANITQHRIAVEGLGKQADFDAIDNPLVRIQAGRLRKQLNEYYASEGRFNPIRIDLPNGSYHPTFTPHQAEANRHLMLLEATATSLSQGPSMVCIPRTFINDEAHGWSCITRLTRDYVSALTRFSFCQVMFADETPWRQANWPQEAWHKYGADFALFFDLYPDQRGYSLKCSLVHNHTGQIIWAHSFSLEESYPEPATLHPIFKRIAHDTLTYDSGVTHSHWVRHLLDSGKPIAFHHQVLVAVRQYIWDSSPATFRTSWRTCTQRLEKFPHDIPALFVYSNHCLTDYMLKYHAIESVKTKLYHATNALLQLAPDNAYSHVYHAISCLLNGNHEQSRTAAETAQAINPLDTYLNVHLGLIYIGLGEWQTGAEFIQDTINISPTYPDWYHLPLSIYHYREGRYLTAMQEINKVRLKHLWTPLLRTAFYQCNQRLEHGAQEYRRLQNDYPDFAQTSRKLTHDFPRQTNHIIQQIWSHLPR